MTSPILLLLNHEAVMLKGFGQAHRYFPIALSICVILVLSAVSQIDPWAMASTYTLDALIALQRATCTDDSRLCVEKSAVPLPTSSKPCHVHLPSLAYESTVHAASGLCNPAEHACTAPDRLASGASNKHMPQLERA
eukprot:scaffold3036_cov414-Prasinococcus_capsulatus_cf.AAC.22